MVIVQYTTLFAMFDLRFNFACSWVCIHFLSTSFAYCPSASQARKSLSLEIARIHLTDLGRLVHMYNCQNTCILRSWLHLAWLGQSRQISVFSFAYVDLRLVLWSDGSAVHVVVALPARSSQGLHEIVWMGNTMPNLQDKSRCYSCIRNWPIARYLSSAADISFQTVATSCPWDHCAMLSKSGEIGCGEFSNTAWR